MRALVYEGPFKVVVKQVEDPKIHHPNDIIVRITSRVSAVRTCIRMKGERPHSRG